MPNQIVPFDFNGAQVRVVGTPEDPRFVASDVLDILGLDRTGLRRLDDDEMGVDSIHTPGGVQNLRTVNESGLFSLILGSRKAEAKSFKKWVTATVLPQIRKTGSYGVQALPTGGQLLALAVIEAQAMLEAKDAQIAELSPRADAWDELASADGDYEVADAAKILARAGIETGRQRLFGQLADMGWIFRGAAGKWAAYQSAVDSGYLAEKPQWHYHPKTGDKVLDPPQVRVTVSGLERLRVRLGSVLRAVEVAS